MDDCVELGCAVLYLFCCCFLRMWNRIHDFFSIFFSHCSSYFITACKARVFSCELLCVAKTALEILKKDFWCIDTFDIVKINMTENYKITSVYCLCFRIVFGRLCIQWVFLFFSLVQQACIHTCTHTPHYHHHNHSVFTVPVDRILKSNYQLLIPQLFLMLKTSTN